MKPYIVTYSKTQKNNKYTCNVPFEQKQLTIPSCFDICYYGSNNVIW